MAGASESPGCAQHRGGHRDELTLPTAYPSTPRQPCFTPSPRSAKSFTYTLVLSPPVSSAHTPGSSLLTHASSCHLLCPAPFMLLLVDRDLLRGTCELVRAAGELPRRVFRPLPAFSHLPRQERVPANRRGPRARNLSPTLPLISCRTLGGGAVLCECQFHRL